jgi:hypothetical protein
MSDDVIKIEPTCRYSHGPLTKLTYPESPQGEWIYLAASGKISFSGSLYVCEACGYTEFFDSDVVRTRQELRGKA